MKRRSSPIAAGLLLAAAWLGVPASALASGEAQAWQALGAIDAERTQLQSAERPLQGFAAEGTRVTAYRRAGRLAKVEVDMLGERSRQVQEFYWAGRTLLAVQQRSGEVGTPGASLAIRERMLLRGDGSIRQWERDGQPQPLQGSIARERATLLRAQARSFRQFVELPEPQGACLWSCTDRRSEVCMRYVCQ